jgi:hypothetical protein
VTQRIAVESILERISPPPENLIADLRKILEQSRSVQDGADESINETAWKALSLLVESLESYEKLVRTIRENLT